LYYYFSKINYIFFLIVDCCCGIVAAEVFTAVFKIEDVKPLKTLSAQYLVDYWCPKERKVYEYSVDKALL